MTISATCVLFFFKDDFYSASHSTEESQTNTSAFASCNLYVRRQKISQVRIATDYYELLCRLYRFNIYILFYVFDDFKWIDLDVTCFIFHEILFLFVKNKN